MFKRYVSRQVVEEMLKSGQDFLEGQRRELSVLFSDIRGFTTLSEHLAPAQVVTLINRYLAPMTDIIMAHHGTIDEFLGDAILAAPRPEGFGLAAYLAPVLIFLALPLPA